jgi:hypothetical protein
MAQFDMIEAEARHLLGHRETVGVTRGAPARRQGERWLQARHGPSKPARGEFADKKTAPPELAARSK